MYACVCEDKFSRPLVVVRGGVLAAWYQEARPPEREARPPEKRELHTKVPLVQVSLVQSVRLRPLQSTLVTVELESSQHLKGPLLLEPTHRFEDESGELQFGNAFVQPTDSRDKALISNPTGIAQKLKEGTWVGRAS